MKMNKKCTTTYQCFFVTEYNITNNMDVILFDAILNCIPFSCWFEKLGCGKELSALLPVVTVFMICCSSLGCPSCPACERKEMLVVGV
jgi:hypothetical protein